MRSINTGQNMSAQAPSPSALIPEQSKKILYIDNLKVLLITLVILHHVLNTYGAEGGWYYWQKTTHPAASIPMVVLITINQSFFMGLFFFLSAYFIPSSYNKKGAVRFVKDRLLRLGLPLVFYSFILSPVLIYLVDYFGKGQHITFLQFLGGFHDWIDFGVLWFVAALLLFTCLCFVAHCGQKIPIETAFNTFNKNDCRVCRRSGLYKFFSADRISHRAGEANLNFIRQYYDVYSLLGRDDVLAFIGTEAYLQHKEKRLSKSDLEIPISKNEAFLLSDEGIRASFKKRYAATSASYYNGQPAFEEIIGRIQKYIDKL